ncbi:MAG: hypothetical protein Q9222_007926 [Ikaeria aurantiellina]
MHSLSQRTSSPTIPALYVKSAPRTYDIRSIFVQARAMAPCMLILEDIDTIVTQSSRSYFFNEVDGLENNDGIFMVASTNHLDRLDPGLSSRPSRFDRKYLFPLPNEHERTLYCEYWRQKLKSKPAIKFPRKLCPAIAGITDAFSFAYLQELFIATLLAIAGHRSEDPQSIIEAAEEGGDGGNDLDDFELWREMKRQVKALRDDMGNSSTLAATAASSGPSSSNPAVFYSEPPAIDVAPASKKTMLSRKGNLVPSRGRGLPIRPAGLAGGAVGVGFGGGKDGGSVEEFLGEDDNVVFFQRGGGGEGL